MPELISVRIGDDDPFAHEERSGPTCHFARILGFDADGGHPEVAHPPTVSTVPPEGDETACRVAPAMGATTSTERSDHRPTNAAVRTTMYALTAVVGRGADRPTARSWRDSGANADREKSASRRLCESGLRVRQPPHWTVGPPLVPSTMTETADLPYFEFAEPFELLGSDLSAAPEHRRRLMELMSSLAPGRFAEITRLAGVGATGAAALDSAVSSSARRHIREQALLDVLVADGVGSEVASDVIARLLGQGRGEHARVGWCRRVAMGGGPDAEARIRAMLPFAPTRSSETPLPTSCCGSSPNVATSTPFSPSRRSGTPNAAKSWDAFATSSSLR